MLLLYRHLLSTWVHSQSDFFLSHKTDLVTTMLKIHQPYPSALRIESKFLPMASRMCRTWHPPSFLSHPYHSLPCSYPRSPADLLCWSHRCFPPLSESAAPSSWKSHHSGQTKAPEREHTSHAKSAHLYFSFIAIFQKINSMSLYPRIQVPKILPRALICPTHLGIPNAQHTAYHMRPQHLFSEDNEPSIHCSWPQILLKSSLKKFLPWTSLFKPCKANTQRSSE